MIVIQENKVEGMLKKLMEFCLLKIVVSYYKYIPYSGIFACPCGNIFVPVFVISHCSIVEKPYFCIPILGYFFKVFVS